MGLCLTVSICEMGAKDQACLTQTLCCLWMGSGLRACHLSDALSPPVDEERNRCILFFIISMTSQHLSLLILETSPSLSLRSDGSIPSRAYLVIQV